jgi:hypothetical protein
MAEVPREVGRESGRCSLVVDHDEVFCVAVFCVRTPIEAAGNNDLVVDDGVFVVV